jgi:hypothetical protein
MLDLIERTKTLIANHPEYMRQNTPCNIPGGHGQRLQKYTPAAVNLLNYIITWEHQC